jgi:2-polyprenyl-3-methyl-5-hydroxy-6-metoxy-1,4-benzoquinol methylase
MQNQAEKSIQMNLPTSQSWDVFWKSGFAQNNHKLSWSKRRILNQINPYLTPGLKVLEAGCGAGFFSNYFIGKSCEVTALDYSQEALDMARNNTQNQAKSYLKEDLLDLELGKSFSGQFNLIFSDGLLEHFILEKQKIILRNWYQMLAPNGVIVTFVPNQWSPWQIIRPWMMPGIQETPFKLKRLKEVHSEFKIIQSGGLNVLPIGLSPEFFGSTFGMLLFVIGRKC